MIKIVNFKDLDKAALEQSVGFDVAPEVLASVTDILGNVRRRGDAAVLDYTERFDGVRPKNLRVSEEEIEQAVQNLSPKLLSTIAEAADNIRAFHQRQKRDGFVIADKPGVMLGQRVTPIDRVGIYVPGGTASYPSTVLMDVIPAKIAGVPRLVMCTPPSFDGSVAPAILAAAKIAGVDEIYKAGGAQAVAALAYGTESVPRVSKIVGPGNIYVAAAKRMVYGLVDIDMIAGPSDILIIADDGANPAFIAADMLAQAEHDTLSRAVLVTTSAAIAEKTARELETQLEKLPREGIAREAIYGESVIIITDGLNEAAECANLIAPEHLEIMVRDPLSLIGAVRNAGSIFVGDYAAEALGDYFAGPNHTLPTMGTAKFSGPLSVDDFIKTSSITYYSSQALNEVSDKIAAMARSEGLEGHARSVEIRRSVTENGMDDEFFDFRRGEET